MWHSVIQQGLISIKIMSLLFSLHYQRATKWPKINYYTCQSPICKEAVQHKHNCMVPKVIVMHFYVGPQRQSALAEDYIRMLCSMALKSCFISWDRETSVGRVKKNAAAWMSRDIQQSEFNCLGAIFRLLSAHNSWPCYKICLNNEIPRPLVLFQSLFF